MDYIVQFRVMNLLALLKLATEARLLYCNFENLHEVYIKDIFLNGVK